MKQLLFYITGTQQPSFHNFEFHKLTDGIFYLIEMIFEIRRTFSFHCFFIRKIYTLLYLNIFV